MRWPGKAEPGSRSDQLICHTDLFATCAEILELDLPKTAAEDSVSFLQALLEQPIISTRAGVIHHSVSGHFAYRFGKWKLLLARGSGGWTAPQEGKAKKLNLPIAQLYDMESDPSETTNRFESEPEVAKQLLAQLTSDIERGRSTDGPISYNDFENIELWKSEKSRQLHRCCANSQMSINYDYHWDGCKGLRHFNFASPVRSKSSNVLSVGLIVK